MAHIFELANMSGLSEIILWIGTVPAWLAAAERNKPACLGAKLSPSGRTCVLNFDINPTHISVSFLLESYACVSCLLKSISSTLPMNYAQQWIKELFSATNIYLPNSPGHIARLVQCFATAQGNGPEVTEANSGLSFGLYELWSWQQLRAECGPYKLLYEVQHSCQDTKVHMTCQMFSSL